MTEQLLFDFLKEHSLPYTLFEHQPVFTVADKPIVTAIGGIPTTAGSIPQPHFKTLFLKDSKHNRFYLVSVLDGKRVDLNALSKVLGCHRFSFGKAEELQALLQLTPGSVTPFGLLFDNDNRVSFVLDDDALNYPQVSFHPLRNDMTIAMAIEDFLRCMEIMRHKPLVAKITAKQAIHE